MAVDGTHTKVRHSMIMLGMTTLDGNGETLLLSWALIPSESKENWMYFLKGMRRFLPGLTEEEAVIISDRAKGLKSALNANFPEAAHSFCCQYLADTRLRRRPSGIPSRAERIPPNRCLSQPQEQALEQFINRFDDTGVSARLRAVRSYTNIMIKQDHPMSP